MPYCTDDLVGDEFGLSFSSSTKPTDTVVDRWITEADALIDSKVGLRFVTPITNATDLLIIRQISIKLVSARVGARLKRKTPVSEADSKGDSSRPVDTHSQAMKMLEQIVNGTLDLPNSSLRNSSNGMTSWHVQDGDCEPHTFQKNEDQW